MLKLSTVLAVAGVVLGSIAAAPRGRPQPCDASPLAVRNVGVWTSGGVLAGQTVVFREGRVAAIEAATAVTGLRTLDGTGHTLLPGLVDSHLHLTIPGGLPPGRPAADASAIAGRQLLRSGVTAGRLHLATLEDAIALKRRSAEPCAALPRLQVGGPGLSGAVDRDFGAFQGARCREDAVAKIERFRAAGVDWVAVHDADRFAAGVLAALADAARRTGLRLMAAGTTPAEIAAALSIEPDTLDYVDRTAASGYPAAVLAAIRARPGLVLVPTPGVPYRTAQYLAHPAALDRPSSVDMYGEADRAFVLATARKDLASAGSARAVDLVKTLPGKLAELRASGVPMAIGSDAGSPLHLQADAIWWELEAWRALGATHREALLAATEHGALVLREPGLGRLVVGARADFVLYRGQVEDGPFDATRVLAVAKDGVLYVEGGRWVVGM